MSMARGARLLLPAVFAALGLLIAQGAAAGKAANPAQAAPMKGGTYYAKGVPLCKTPKKVNYSKCFAMKRVLVKKGTPGAQAFTVNTTPTPGPAGGFTPTELAGAYGYPFVASGTGTGTKVAIVDAYNDPNIESDLQVYDSHYGLGTCTRANGCLNVVNQTGGACLANGTGCPPADSGWAGEETLDVQAVRAVCTNCKIYLVETNSNSNADLAAGVNRAYTLGARIISNSYGGPESPVDTTANAAYNHPYAVITASTGDDGWYGWDYMNDFGSSDNMPSSPASLNTVVAVGGTSLYLAQNGARGSETVWNNNGPADYYGYNLGLRGATGGGCSTVYSAQSWQTHVTGWSATPCGTHRLAADISADADPLTGFDIYDTYGSGGWQTIGGTSLASPLVAAMWALAGVPAGIKYPALLPYGHLKDASLYDVTTGGNGYCDALTVGQCLGPGLVNPNSLGYGMIDCDYTNTSQPGTPATGVGQCDAAPGYDGPSGVGTPKGLTSLRQVVGWAKMTTPATITHGVSGTYKDTGSIDPYPGGVISTCTWSWGDGTSNSTGCSTTHTYTTTGTKTLKLTIKDSYGASSTVSKTITVG
jgi:subtilase family serine protease